MARIGGKLKSSLPQPGSETKRGTEVSPSDQNLPPDLKDLIETIMRFLRQKDWHPKLLLTTNEHGSILDPSREAKLNANGLIAKFHPKHSKHGERNV
jgi:hypothetical protein